MRLQKKNLKISSVKLVKYCLLSKYLIFLFYGCDFYDKLISYLGLYLIERQENQKAMASVNIGIKKQLSVQCVILMDMKLVDVI